MQPESNDPPPVPPAAPLPYRKAGANPGSQWYTDEHAYGAAMVYGLIALTILGSIVGVVWWLVSSVAGYFFGW